MGVLHLPASLRVADRWRIEIDGGHLSHEISAPSCMDDGHDLSFDLSYLSYHVDRWALHDFMQMKRGR